MIDILGILLDAKYTGFAGAVTFHPDGLAVMGWEGFVIIGVHFGFKFFALFSDKIGWCLTDEIIRVVVEQFELRIEFIDVVAGGRACHKKLVFGFSEDSEDGLGALGAVVGDFVGFVEHEGEGVIDALEEGLEGLFEGGDS